jgi:hypothetical protein
MLALPGTRQMIINQALNQWGINKISLLSQIAAVWKYIDQQIKMLLAAKLTIQNIK